MAPEALANQFSIDHPLPNIRESADLKIKSVLLLDGRRPLRARARSTKHPTRDTVVGMLCPTVVPTETWAFGYLGLDFLRQIYAQIIKLEVFFVGLLVSLRRPCCDATLSSFSSGAVPMCCRRWVPFFLGFGRSRLRRNLWAATRPPAAAALTQTPTTTSTAATSSGWRSSPTGSFSSAHSSSPLCSAQPRPTPFWRRRSRASRGKGGRHVRRDARPQPSENAVVCRIAHRG